MHTRTTLALALSAASLAAHAYTSYANDFIDPKLILDKEFSNITVEAQETIVEWADVLAAMGPWSAYRSSFPSVSVASDADAHLRHRT